MNHKAYLVSFCADLWNLLATVGLGCAETPARGLKSRPPQLTCLSPLGTEGVSFSTRLAIEGPMCNLISIRKSRNGYPLTAEVA